MEILFIKTSFIFSDATKLQNLQFNVVFQKG